MSNRDRVETQLGNRWLERPRPCQSVAVERDEIPAGPLVEPQRGGVVIGGDEPEPPPTGAPRQRSGGIQQQGPDSGDVCRRLAPRRSARQPRTRGHAADDAGEPLELAERPTASEPRRYDSFCNVAATATGLVTVSKTGDSDRAASRISCRVSSSASEATR